MRMQTNIDQKTEWTCKRLLEWTADYLGQAEVDAPRLCAEVLLAQVLGYQRIDLYVRFDQCPDQSHRGTYKDLVRRCAQKEPVAYLTGKASFYSLELDVSPECLIPRPETEQLVVHAIEFLRDRDSSSLPRVLDLCTGSGCIAVALAASGPDADIFASDVSPGALAIAQKNITRHNHGDQITLLESNLFENVETAVDKAFDLIVSNPPYISQTDYEKLDAMVRDYEPKTALWAGTEGLDFIGPLIVQSGDYLNLGGALILEIAYNQAERVEALMQQVGFLTDIQIHKDTFGRQRIIEGRKK